MKFFKPEDFPCQGIGFEYEQTRMAEAANDKLEREGKVVYIRKGNGEYDSLGWTEHQNVVDNHKALLINIEPIERCKHPAEKVKLYNEDGTCIFETFMGILTQAKCECGAKVKPTQFEEIDLKKEYPLNRKEQIEEAAKGFRNAFEYDGYSFVAGAEWADANPIVKMLPTEKMLEVEVETLRKALAIATEALEKADDQMDYYQEDIKVPTSWQDVRNLVKEALAKISSDEKGEK